MAATCTSPAKCSCGETKGSKLGHDFGGNYTNCSRCNEPNPNYVASAQVPTPQPETEPELIIPALTTPYYDTNGYDLNVWSCLQCTIYSPHKKVYLYLNYDTGIKEEYTAETQCNPVYQGHSRDWGMDGHLYEGDVYTCSIFGASRGENLVLDE